MGRVIKVTATCDLCGAVSAEYDHPDSIPENWNKLALAVFSPGGRANFQSDWYLSCPQHQVNGTLHEGHDKYRIGTIKSLMMKIWGKV